MELGKIRNLKESNSVLINGINYVCTMVTGYASNPCKNFRFTDMSLPKNEQNTVYNQLYLSCTELHEKIKLGELSLLIIGDHQENVQLKLF